jgi:hypothetical protein
LSLSSIKQIEPFALAAKAPFGALRPKITGQLKNLPTRLIAF